MDPSAHYITLLGGMRRRGEPGERDVHVPADHPARTARLRSVGGEHRCTNRIVATWNGERLDRVDRRQVIVVEVGDIGRQYREGKRGPAGSVLVPVPQDAVRGAECL